jgi:hypothetical protein
MSIHFHIWRSTYTSVLSLRVIGDITSQVYTKMHQIGLEGTKKQEIVRRCSKILDKVFCRIWGFTHIEYDVALKWGFGNALVEACFNCDNALIY